MMKELAGKTAFITGSSRGIGFAIASRLAQAGANVVITGKTTESHPSLPGTIYTAAKEIQEAGGSALAIHLDVRSLESIQKAVAKTVSQYGGIDILINNASAIDLSPTATMQPKRFDLLQEVNGRGTFLTTQACIKHLAKGTNPHVINLSPPLSFEAKWFKKHTPYTISKYTMSLCTIGLAQELAQHPIAVNSLWPKTIIDTSALRLFGGEQIRQAARTPEIMADAAIELIKTPAQTITGQLLIDEDFLRTKGFSDMSKYSVNPKVELANDLFID